MIEQILSTNFARKSIETKLICQNRRPCAANVFRCLLEEIDRMAKSCQLTEFTEHGLPHLFSLINRIETWTIQDGSKLINNLSYDETCLLFFAVIIHDIGMLSQRESDLNEKDQIIYARQFADLSGWVRRTHTLRIENITYRILEGKGYKDFCNSDYFKIVCELARSHNYWPDSKEFKELFKLDNKNRLIALAGILAVADLLDEDSSRCDSMTLFSNKAGTLLNRAHWLRHMLTANCLKIDKGIVQVTFQEPFNLLGKIEGAYIGLENHLKQCYRYNKVLSEIRADIRFTFDKDRVSCEPLPEDDNELAMLYCQPNIHLLRTFQNEILPYATIDKPQGTEISFNGIELRTVDREIYDIVMGISESNFNSSYTDYEITYLASLLSGENYRKVSVILQRRAWQLHERGDIVEIQRLSSFVLEETLKLNKEGKRPFIDDNIYWAVVFLIHWANSEADLRRVSSLFDPGSMRGYIDPNKLIDGVALKWKIILLTCYFIFQKKANMKLSLIEQIMDEQINDGNKIDSEVALAWYNLIEAIWGKGYFNNDSQLFWQKFKLLQDKESDDVHPVLKELSWRMSIQSRCLKGLNRWQFCEVSTDRIEHNLTQEPARESLAEYWMNWFNDNEISIEKLHRLNPNGAELYISGLEAEFLTMTTGDFIYFHSNISKINTIRKKIREVREKDQSCVVLGNIRANLLSENHLPKDDETTYLYKREVELLPVEFFIGERIALRRWFLEGWRRLIHTNIQRILNSAYSLSLEGENVSEAIIFCISEIAWATLDNYAVKKLRKILEMNDNNLSSEQIHNLIEQILNCPLRICSIIHPGLNLLEDTFTSEFIPRLIELTNRRLNTQKEFHINDYIVWNNILPYIELPPEQWYSLYDLIFKCFFSSNKLYNEAGQIVDLFFQLAPWEQVSNFLELIINSLESDGVDKDWFEDIKSRLVSIINRKDQSWKDSPQINKIILILRNRNNNSEVNKDDILLAEWLENPKAEHIGPLYEELAISMVENIERIASEAIARTSNNTFTFGGIYLNVLAKLPPVSKELATRSAQALNRIWSARYPTFEEIDNACLLATYILRSSCPDGVIVIFEAFFNGMESKRFARDLAGEMDGSEVPWKYLSKNLSLVPDYLLSRLYQLVVCRIVDLSVHSVGAIAACLFEIAMRATEVEIRKLAYNMLFSLRIKINKYEKYNTEAFVQAVNRFVANSEKGYVNDNLLSFLIEWSKNIINYSKIKYRFKIAQALNKLINIIEVDDKNLELMIESLKNDPHMRIRNIFRNKE